MGMRLPLTPSTIGSLCPPGIVEMTQTSRAKASAHCEPETFLPLRGKQQNVDLVEEIINIFGFVTGDNDDFSATREITVANTGQSRLELLSTMRHDQFDDSSRPSNAASARPTLLRALYRLHIPSAGDCLFARTMRPSGREKSVIIDDDFFRRNAVPHIGAFVGFRRREKRRRVRQYVKDNPRRADKKESWRERGGVLPAC